METSTSTSTSTYNTIELSNSDKSDNNDNTPTIQRKLTKNTANKDLLETLPFSLRLYLRWTSLLRSPHSLIRKIFLCAAGFGYIFFCGPINGWNAVEIKDPVTNLTHVSVSLDTRIDFFGFTVLVLFLLFAPRWINAVSTYLSDGGIDLAQHWSRFSRHDASRVTSLSRVSNVFLFINVMFALLIFSVFPGAMANNYSKIPIGTPAWYYLYWWLIKILPGPCMILCSFPMVFLIAPLFKLITEAQVISVQETFVRIKHAIHMDMGTVDMDRKQEIEHKEDTLLKLTNQISQIVEEEAAWFSKANKEFSRAAASIACNLCLNFLAMNLQSLLKLVAGEPFTEKGGDFVTQLIFNLLLNIFFVGIPLVVLQKCIVPGMAWERLCQSLYQPKNAGAFSKKVNGLYSIQSFVHGMELHVMDFGWRFFGVQMTMGLFRAVAGAMVTLIGVLAAAIFRSVEI